MDFPRQSPGTKQPLPKIKSKKFMDWLSWISLYKEALVIAVMKVGLLLTLLRILCTIGVVATQEDTSNISAVLDDILHNYNKKIRPGFGALDYRFGIQFFNSFAWSKTVKTKLFQVVQSKTNILIYVRITNQKQSKNFGTDKSDGPTEILADIYLRSMGPVSEKDMVYTLDFYFRQRWMDERLATNATLENISVSINMLDMIWSPDTIFYNGRKSHLHVVPQPNRFIRIGKNGSIYFSQRLTVRAICRMKLQNYPLDYQNCPLHFGSFAYSESDVIYKWRYGDSESVELAPNMQMSQFDLINFSASHSTILRKSTYHSMLSVRFDLKRHTGYFLINIFIPCMLLVILSWVSFWINREATSDRIALGTTTVLTMTFLALDSRSDLPRVSYATALDLYIAMCFLFVLATILEFAVVHHFTKIRHGDAIHIPVPVPVAEKDRNNDLSAKAEYIRQRRLQRLKHLNNGTSETPINNRTFLTRSASSRLRVWCSSLKYKITSSRRRKEPEVNSVSMLDKTCRILFPTVFAILNLAYWIMYSA